MAEPSLKEKRRGLEFANQLAELASTAPDGFSKRRIYRAVSDMRQHYGFSDDEKRRYIALYLDAGCSNIGDLCRETGWHKAQISEIIRGMESDGHVRITPLSISTGGRPGEHIRLLVDKTHFVTPKI